MNYRLGREQLCMYRLYEDKNAVYRSSLQHVLHHPTSGYDFLTTNFKKIYENVVLYDSYNDFKDDRELCFRLMRYIPKAYSKNFYMRLSRDSLKLQSLETGQYESRN
eukprot:1817904-Amphidinium_carterae.1